jgi:signal transduction histidine kinase
MVRKSNQTFVEDLRERNRQLQKAYDELQSAQAELLRNERLTTMGKFSSMILHDIRNPISVIKAYADMLVSKGDLEEKNLKYIENISFETQRLNQLANELLDYSRGEIRLDMELVEISDFLREVTEYASRRMTSKSIRIICKDNYGGQIIFDRQRMTRVFANLLENARKAMGHSGTCTISADRQGELLRLEVKDDGVGMSEEVMKHIYEPFYSSSPQGGTGLGMAIVKSVVEAHHGLVEIESTEGSGTTVGVSLPLRL